VTTVESNCAYTLSEIQLGGYIQTAVSCVDTGNGNAPVSYPVSLNEGQDVTCTIFNDDELQGSITVFKEVDNDQGGTAVPGDFALHVAGDDGDGGNCSEDGAVDRTSPYLVGTPVNGCTYTISEETPPAGYTLRGIVCVEDGGAVDDATFTWASGETWTCTVTNDDDGATLTLVKTVTNDNGGSAVVTDWILTANGPTPISGQSGQPAVTNQNVTAGDYPLSESGGPPSGYTPGAWGCTGDGTLTNESLAIANGETATCTINNNDQTATLTLVKSVTNDDGGTAVVDDWTLTADGDTDYAGNTTGFWTGGVAVDADTYTLLESTVAGYSAGDWQCTGDGSLVNNQLTLGPGETASCTIVNNDIAPRLTLLKSVTNDNGGAAIADGFTLNLQGVDGTHDTAQDYGNGATPAVQAGVVYTMDETLIDGYANEGVVCEDTGDGGGVVDQPVTLALDQDVTCTITNNDIAPTLIMVKDLTNDDGGALTVTDFTLTLTGTDGALGGNHDSGQPYVDDGEDPPTTPTIFGGVQYTVSEDPVPDNYTMTGIVCTDTDTQQEIVNPFIPLLAQNISCTVSNDDDEPTLTLIKEVINDDGGSATPGTFTLKLTGADGIHDTGENYTSGDMPVIHGEIEYTVAEIEDPDYEFLGIVCRDVSGADVGNPFTVTTGDDITCTATNDDIQRMATFWVTKDFVPDNSMEVEVFISCNDGLPLNSHQVITEDSDGVTFVVELFTPGNLDCEITEVPVPGGYDDSYDANALDGEAGFFGNVDGCQFEEVVGGDFKCEITNTAQDAVFEVNKVWDLIGEGGDRINQVIEISISCTEEILLASPAPDSGPGFSQGRYLVSWLGLEGNTTVRVTVDSSDGTANCRARERIFDDSVESDNPCRNDRPLTIGQTTYCTITNTVFFEGIPTLSRYSLAILALLMLGIGAVGLRRFS